MVWEMGLQARAAGAQERLVLRERTFVVLLELQEQLSDDWQWPHRGERSRKATPWKLLPRTRCSRPASSPPGGPFPGHCLHLGQGAWLTLVLLAQIQASTLPEASCTLENASS